MSKAKIIIFLLILAGAIFCSFFLLKSGKKEIISDFQAVTEEKISLNDQQNNPDKEADAESLAPEESKKPEEPAKTEIDKAIIEKNKIIQKSVSWGYSSANSRSIDTIIIHSSYNALGGDVYDLEKLIKEYKEYGVAPHYLIDRKGNIYQLVSDKNIAYHAGESKMPDGRTNINNFSIGIELMNTESDKPANIQYESLNSLVKALKAKYKIKNVLGHKQIAPGRKTDPWNFDWSKLK